MKNAYKVLSAMILMFCAACGADDTAAPVEPTDTSAMNVRGARYCEILTGYQEALGVRIDVYNTYGLNDCPAAAWEAVDAAKVQADTGADSVILNGPRHWIIDGFVNSALLDTTPVTLGGIEMRKAGELNLTIAEAMSAGVPYQTRPIKRNTTYAFQAGKLVYELVDPEGRVFVMQSFSLEVLALTEADLEGLASKLTLPEGWIFRARQLSEELHVTAVDGLATVVQDNLENTYQLAPQ
ncbi:MAG: hypothetical protein HUU21_03900 [Polyangiaceae bacterium]|nr:hypothetical protein [Polyangiaceae bacterium]NUQ72677.1 hypothetical protein [Polyangiaceae bacterium]